MKNFKDNTDCLERFEALRQRMISTALLYGMSHPLVLKYSQEIDHYHNQMMNAKAHEVCPT